MQHTATACTHRCGSKLREGKGGGRDGISSHGGERERERERGSLEERHGSAPTHDGGDLCCAVIGGHK